MKIHKSNVCRNKNTMHMQQFRSLPRKANIIHHIGHTIKRKHFDATHTQSHHAKTHEYQVHKRPSRENSNENFSSSFSVPEAFYRHNSPRG